MLFTAADAFGLTLTNCDDCYVGRIESEGPIESGVSRSPLKPKVVFSSLIQLRKTLGTESYVEGTKTERVRQVEPQHGQ
jgi:hypothetical protein